MTAQGLDRERRRGAILRANTALFRATVSAALLSGAAHAARADCPVSAYSPRGPARDAAMAEARGLSTEGRLADARATYLWVMARHPDDMEALAGLARVDAWGGCSRVADREYRTVLAAHPDDADVRAGFVDLLTWSGRVADAERALEEGLAGAPNAPELLARAARFAYWRGEAMKAVRLRDAAERGSGAGEMRSELDHVFVGEGRIAARADIYPPGLPSAYTTSAQALQRIGRFELRAGGQVVARTGGPVDERLPFGVSFHPAMGWTIGGDFTLGVPPTHAVPGWAVRGSLLAPLDGPLDGSISYEYWHFDDAAHIQVHLVNPAIGIALPKDVRLELRLLIAVVGGELGGASTSQVAATGGAQITWSATPRLDLAATFTYGQELEPTTFATQLRLLGYTGPGTTAHADVLINRQYGLRPMAGVQVLEDDAHRVISIESMELGVFRRW